MKLSSIAAFTSIALLTACDSTNNKESTNKTSPTSIQPLEKEIKNINPFELKKTRLLTINNQKFEFNGKKLTTSSKIRSIRTSQIGSISGSFIILSKERPTPAVLGLPINDDASLVSPNTWRFTANRGTDFLALYKQLESKYKKVEMSIKYGGIDREEQ